MRVVRDLAAALIALSSLTANAQTYPNKPIRLVVAFAAGSSTDAVARLIAQDLGRRLGPQVIVEDRPGANGQLGSVFVAKSPADGYTLLISSNTTHAANQHLYKKLPYDPVKDFVPLVRIGNIPFMLLVNPALPVKSTQELIAYARAHPAKISYATSNSTSLVAAETLNVMAGISMVGVQYKASQQAIIDLISNQVQVMVCDFAVATPHVRAGKLRALAVSMGKRTVLKPELPPIGDTLKGFDFTPWNGMFAPAGTPKEIVDRLTRELLELINRPEMKAKLAAVGIEANPLGTDAFARFIQDEIAHWGRLVRAARIQPE